MQAKKTGNCKKDVFVPILFLYLEKHLYKILIYNMLLYIKITFTRFLYENKLHFPCIQYVTAKVAYSAEIAKHPALSGAVAVINCAKFLKTKFLSNSREYGIETLLVVSWVNLLRRFLVLRRPCKSPARSSAVPTSDTLICR